MTTSVANANGGGHAGVEKQASDVKPVAESTTSNKDELRLRELRDLLGKAEGDPLRMVGVGAGAWGSVFIAMLQDTYGAFRDSIQVLFQMETLILIRVTLIRFS